jgi:hypothetical protein
MGLLHGRAGGTVCRNVALREDLNRSSGYEPSARVAVGHSRSYSANDARVSSRRSPRAVPSRL